MADSEERVTFGSIATLSPKLAVTIEDTIEDLRRGQIVDPSDVSIRVATTLQSVLGLPFPVKATAGDVAGLMSHVGALLCGACSTSSSGSGSVWAAMGTLRRTLTLLRTETMQRAETAANEVASPAVIIAGAVGGALSSITATPTTATPITSSSSSSSSSLTSSLEAIVQAEAAAQAKCDTENIDRASQIAVRASDLTTVTFPSISSTTSNNGNNASSSSSNSSSSNNTSTVRWTRGLAASVREGISEILSEVENLSMGLAATSVNDLLRPGDAILLLTPNDQIAIHWLQEASKKRPFEVFVCEGGDGKGKQIATLLSAPSSSLVAEGIKPIQVTVIPEASAVAILPRISKVLLSASAVTLYGDVVAPAGTFAVCCACGGSGSRGTIIIPIITLASTLQLLPVTDANNLRGMQDSQQQQQQQIDPATIMPYHMATSRGLDGSSNSSSNRIFLPKWDIIPASCISVIVSTSGSTAPGDIWRVMEDLYA